MKDNAVIDYLVYMSYNVITATDESLVGHAVDSHLTVWSGDAARQPGLTSALSGSEATSRAPGSHAVLCRLTPSCSRGEWYGCHQTRSVTSSRPQLRTRTCTDVQELRILMSKDISLRHLLCAEVYPAVVKCRCKHTMRMMLCMPCPS